MPDEHIIIGALADPLPPVAKCVTNDADAATLAADMQSVQALQNIDRNDVREQAALAFHPVLLVHWPARTPDVNPWPFGKVYCPPHNEPGR